MTLTQPNAHNSPLLDVARKAWFQALSDFYSPPLPEPVIEHSDEATSFFYVDDKTWTIHINTAGVPHYMTPAEAEPFLRSICHHELQHYLVCPYDTVTSAMMFARARRHVNNATAMFVCNLFADLVVDSLLLRRFPQLTHDRILSSIHESAIRGETHSDLWVLIVTCYRVMWGFPIPRSVSVPDDTFEAAEAIVAVTKKYRDNERKWPKATEEIAKIISQWRHSDDEQLSGAGGDFAGGEEGGDEGGDRRIEITIPLDVDAIMGSPVEIRNGEVARRCADPSQTPNSDDELARLASDVESRGGDLDDLRAVLLLLGAGTYGRGWTRFWYRAKVRRLIRIDVHEQRPEGAIPLTPQVWRLGDPIEELDLVQSLQAFPVLVPNMSTRRWLRIESFGDTESRTPPDLLIVIDSSGSMTWSMSRTRLSGEYHLALISAFGAMNFAFARGCRVAAINFSVETRIAKWSRNRQTIEDVLLSYQGGGTIMPVGDMIHLCDEARRPVLVLMITDAEVDNGPEMVSAVKHLSSRGHHVFMFHIHAGEDENHIQLQKRLLNAGARIVPVNNQSDLVGLVLRDTRAVYGI
ncbi:MAG: hypothetical protein ACTSYL_05405 [Candidatus Thorarchaeota archaeon]